MENSYFDLNDSLYRNVKNFDEALKTSDYDGFIKPTSKRSQEFYLKKVKDIFEQQDLANLIKECQDCKPFLIAKRKDNVSREYLYYDMINFHPVNFDSEGRVHKENMLSYRIDLPEIVQKAIRIGLERFGMEMGWKDVTKNIACNFVRNKLPADEEITLLDWHDDMNTRYSFVVSLNNSHEEDKGWIGGKFCYAAQGDMLRHGRKNFWKMASDTHFASTKDPAHPTWTLSTSQNEGVLFSNLGTLHFVEPLKAYSKDNSPVDRIILSFFEQMIW